MANCRSHRVVAFNRQMKPPTSSYPIANHVSQFANALSASVMGKRVANRGTAWCRCLGFRTISVFRSSGALL